MNAGYDAFGATSHRPARRPPLRRQRLRAASFSAGTNHAHDTGFSFPVVNEGAQTVFVGEVAILARPGKQADVIADVQGPPLSASFTAYTGRSADLAFVLARLHSLGFHVKKGLYTGEVRDFYADSKTASFEILPIDFGIEKAAAFPRALRGLTADGWFNERLRKLTAGQLFEIGRASCRERV